MVIVFIYGSGR